MKSVEFFSEKKIIQIHVWKAKYTRCARYIQLIHLIFIKIAEMQMESYSQFMYNMIQSCQSKCISTHYTEPDLHKGEALCIDRCVSKYFETSELIGKKINPS